MIRRTPLRERVFQALVSRFLAGELPAGSRLSDSALARELGVSRTPVREALMRLEREGFVDADVGRGFFVKPLSPDELRRLLPIFAVLQALAAREGAPHDPALLDRLEALIEEQARVTDDPERSARMSLRWHQMVIDASGNGFLQAQLATLSRVLRRYAHAFWREAGHARHAAAAQVPVLARLRAGDADGAARLLEAYWQANGAEMVGWLEGRAPR